MPSQLIQDNFESYLQIQYIFFIGFTKHPLTEVLFQIQINKSIKIINFEL